MSVAALLLAAYAGVVLLITLSPIPVDRPYSAALLRLIQELHERGLPAWIGYGEIEFGANVLLFLPVGFLLALLLPRRAWGAVVLLAPIFSALIESAQALFLTERFPSLLDVLANGFGGILGAILSMLVRLLVRERDALLLADVNSGARPAQRSNAPTPPAPPRSRTSL